MSKKLEKIVLGGVAGVFTSSILTATIGAGIAYLYGNPELANEIAAISLTTGVGTACVGGIVTSISYDGILEYVEEAYKNNEQLLKPKHQNQE